jgi:hypothetical protein
LFAKKTPNIRAARESEKYDIMVADKYSSGIIPLSQPG